MSGRVETAQTARAAVQQQQTAEIATARSVTLLFDRENGQPISPARERPISVTDALAACLARAVQINVGSGDETPLSFSSLLIAMVIDEDAWLRDHLNGEGAKIDAITTRRSYREESLRSIGASDVGGPHLTSISARRALEEAERIARLSSGVPTAPVDLRHLCAAFPVLSNWHLDDFASFEIDRLEWARAFGAEMARRFPIERHYWQRYADRASPVPLTSFSADVYTDDDLLGIDRTVDALSLVIASTRTVTPLAIGVFGPWGSGKTFFMRHLQKRIVDIRQREKPRIDAWIAKRRAESAKAEDAPLYFGQIAQVEFNAWHYNEGNLVASLVEHLFRNLRLLPDGDVKDLELEARKAQTMSQLTGLEEKVTTTSAEIDSAKTKLDEAKVEAARATAQAETAKKDVAAKSREIQEKSAALAGERKKLDDSIAKLVHDPKAIDTDALVAVALAPLEPLLQEMRGAIRSAKDEAFSWSEFAGRVFSLKGLAVVALCLGAPIVGKFATDIGTEWAAFGAAISTAIAGFGNALDVLRKRRAEFEAKMDELEREEKRRLDGARVELEAMRDELVEETEAEVAKLTETLGAQRAALAEREAEVSRAARELAERARDYDTKVAERVEAEAKAREAKAKLDRLSSALLLEEFIADRSSTADYRKELGFLAVVRRDIERLSKLIADANARWLEPENKDDPPLLNRIVLYIDDLDRCKEEKVIAVLEAVHLLLAFPLFVCAVAVDPRWIEKCLHAKRSRMFLDDAAEGGSTPATVGDYLEKIFQIPIWMAPIEGPTRAALVNSLLGPSAAPVRAANARGTNGASAKPAPPTAEPNAFNALVAKAKERPDPLRISPEEAEYVEEVAALLSDRPRALKRFVNVYRLLKASLPDIERAGFVSTEPSSAYRICISQLAFFTSHPRLAPALIEALESPSPASEEADIQTWFDALEARKQKELRTSFELVPDRNLVMVADFRRWLPLTTRYLFHRAI
jgi:hypothetical protein